MIKLDHSLKLGNLWFSLSENLHSIYKNSKAIHVLIEVIVLRENAHKMLPQRKKVACTKILCSSFIQLVYLKSFYY